MKQKFINFAFYMTAYALLMYGYYEYIVPIYGYSGFELAPNMTKLPEALTVIFFVSFGLPSEFTKPSDLYTHLQFMFPILPMLVLYVSSDTPREYIYYTLVAFGVLYLAVNSIRLKSVTTIEIHHGHLQVLLLQASMLCIALIIALGGYRYFNLDFTKVYELRWDAAANLPGLFGYFSPMVGKVLLPFSLLLAIVHKRRFMIVASILGSVVMFGLTNQKGPLFYPFAVMLIYYTINSKRPLQMLFTAYVAGVAFSIAGFYYGGFGEWIGTLFMRRTYFVPAHINMLYYDFFSVNPTVLWAESKLTFGAIDYGYTIDVAHLIGYEYYSHIETGANTGWIGSGYMQYGFIGMIIYAFIVGLMLNFLDAYSEVIDSNIVTSIIFPPIIALFISTDLPTAFLTHGLLLSFILLSIFSTKEGKVGIVGRE